jgi:hypothetical protein
MGCDIHVYTEVKKKVNKEEQWVCADYFKKNPYFGIDEYEKKEWEVVNIYRDRNYALFAVLAGVRNYGENAPIAVPKGLPDDCCPETLKEFEDWDSDGHSHSWYTLGELKGYMKTYPKVKYSGLITAEQSEALDNGIFPNSWCQWSSQNNLIKREWEELLECLNPIVEKLKDRLKEWLWLWDDKQVEENSEKIRMVFWFDN